MKSRLRAVGLVSVALVHAVMPQAHARPKRPSRIRMQAVRVAIPPSQLHAAGTGTAVLLQEPTPAEVAIHTAMAQVGKPYRYGSRGPNAFDCSGLVGYAYQAAGVLLPRSSSQMRRAVRPVALNALQRGDLVFSPGHVGLYIGDGKMVHAPRTGEHVEVAPIHARTSFAGRP